MTRVTTYTWCGLHGFQQETHNGDCEMCAKTIERVPEETATKLERYR